MNFSFEPFPVLQTSRLLLRNFSKDDYAQVFFLRSDKEVNSYIKRVYPKKIEEAIAFVDKVQSSMKNGENVNWAICQKEDSKMMGSICLWNFSSDLKTGEVGYDLHPDFQNRGYMGEAMKAVLRFGFEELQLDHIKAFTHHSNESSKKLLKNNGFVMLPDEKDVDNKDNIILCLSKHQVK